VYGERLFLKMKVEFDKGFALIQFALFTFLLKNAIFIMTEWNDDMGIHCYTFLAVDDSTGVINCICWKNLSNSESSAGNLTCHFPLLFI
jgi:hypothetical protein